MIGTLLRIRYEIVQEIDVGPVFATYKARDRVGGRDVFVRLLQPPFDHESGLIERLKEVVSQHSELRHPGVERLLELDEHEGTKFLVSEASTGQRLDDRIKRMAPFSGPICVGTGIAICEALEALQAEGLVHGDLSANHVFATPDGKARVTLGGVWTAYGGSKTAGSVVLPAMAPYMAPEVAEGQMPHSGSDVYAVGVLLYELATGRHPYSADTPMSMALKHATAPVPALRAAVPAISPILEEIVKKAMAKSPRDRYPDAKSMLADLRILQDSLRFGRQLSWPLTGPKIAPQPEGPTRVAPEMGAVRNKAREQREPDEEFEGLPKWLTGLGYLALCVVLVMVGGYLAWNFTKPKMVQVPNVEGLSSNEAMMRLQDLGLDLKPGRKQPSETKPEGTVLETNPPSGSMVKQGGTVLAVTSSGSKFVEVPDLLGRTIDDARELLSRLSLELQEPVRKVRSREHPPGTVVGQVPDPRSKIERLSKIRVDVAADSADASSSGTTRESTFVVKVTMPTGVLEPVMVKIDMIDDEGTRTIYEQQTAPGAVIEQSEKGLGSEVTFRIFFDGELVKQVTQPAEPEPPAPGQE